jgi:hypothetical protein
MSVHHQCNVLQALEDKLSRVRVILKPGQYIIFGFLAVEMMQKFATYLLRHSTPQRFCAVQLFLSFTSAT